MPTEGERLARVAGDIMFGDTYMDLLESIYSKHDSIVEFESDPKSVLRRNGIDVPSSIEVIIHDPGALGRPARLDFHWREAARSDMRAARQKLRELARLAWDTLHSLEMKRLTASVEASPTALKEFVSNPKAYSAAHGVSIPEGLDLVVHDDDPKALRIDLHFTVGPMGGCCYCKGGGCCYYALQ
jgi:hypothetical protein